MLSNVILYMRIQLFAICGNSSIGCSLEAQIIVYQTKIPQRNNGKPFWLGNNSFGQSKFIRVSCELVTSNGVAAVCWKFSNVHFQLDYLEYGNHIHSTENGTILLLTVE